MSAPDLSELLVLLHGAETPFETVVATWREWRHETRFMAAWHAQVEEERRRGASISSFGARRDAEERPPERVEFLRMWRDGDRVREQREGGERDGYYAVRSGETWWLWNEQSGAHTNAGDTSVGSAVGEELAEMLDPTPLLGLLRWSALGRGMVAGRPTLTAEARARVRDPNRHHDTFALHRLGMGADLYRFEVDAARGVLLEVSALRDGAPFHTVTATEIAFDGPIDEARFRFEAPDGEEVKDFADRAAALERHALPLADAQARAPFTVLVPARVPGDWQVHCHLFEPTQRPPDPWFASIDYRSVDGHQGLSLTQYAAGEQPGHYRADDAEIETIDGVEVWVRDTGTQIQVSVEKQGTFVFLMTETLPAGRLAEIAAGLVPAPAGSEI